MPGAVVPTGQSNVVVVLAPGAIELMVLVPDAPAMVVVTVTFASGAAPVT